MHILFTSASTPTAVALARVLTAEGHVVHAADKESFWGTAPARYSRAYRRYHRLTETYNLAELWKAIGNEVDLVIPFRPLPGYIIESLKSRGANIIGEVLAHNDYEFQDFVRANIIDVASTAPSIVKVPTSFIVHSQTCIAEILSNRESTFSLQPLPCYDDDEVTLVDIGPTSASSSAIESTTPLIVSYSNLNERTVEAIKRLSISDTKPYRLIERAEGGSFYSAHAFVHAGNIRTFVVANARARSKDFVIVSSNQPLYDIFYQFMLRLVEALETWQTAVANHLSLTFHVQDKIEYGELIRRVTLISCHNEPHPSLILLSSVPSIRRQLALAYTSPSSSNDHFPVGFPSSSRRPKALYSAPLAASELGQILLKLRPWRWESWTSLAHIVMMCWVWVVNFKEEIWEATDVGPALCFWGVMLIKSVARIRGIKTMTGHLARGFRMVGATFSVILAIWRFWFAMLMVPWYRKMQH